MARMIPSFIDESAPSGERAVFQMLAGGPHDWAVMHSLDIAPWNHGRRTEIDFVVIIPDCGILCVEVKSHPRIDFDGGRWYPDTIKRSPFIQAADARYSLKRRLSNIAPYAERIPVLHCCIFPNARFDIGACVSVGPWELMDSTAFRSFNDSEEFCRDLHRRFVEGLELNEVGRRARLESPIPPAQVANLVELCVPIQRRRPSAAEETQERHLEIEKLLREQQRPVLRLSERNERLLVTGGAGTGKTLIAMELARRAAERGERVALICFNRLVGEWMASAIFPEPAPPNLIVGTAHSVLMAMAGISVPSSPDAEFWTETVLDLLEERFTDPELATTSSFDHLIVDEAQDLLARPRLWECLCSLLHGGLANGRIAVFGDLDHQVLGSREGLAATTEAFRETARPASWHLSENCRNFPSVGTAALSLSGLPLRTYSGYLRTGDSVHDIAYVPHDGPDRQLEALQQVLRDIKKQGYRNRDITILSFVSAGRSIAPALEGIGYRIASVPVDGDCIGYCSVHAFKGLENRAIILTDMDLEQGDLSRAIFYTAVTRSTGIVRVVCQARECEILMSWAKETRP